MPTQVSRARRLFKTRRRRWRIYRSLDLVSWLISLWLEERLSLCFSARMWALESSIEEQRKKCEIQAIDVGIELHTLDASSWKSTLKGNGQPSSRSFANQEIYEQSHDYELSGIEFLLRRVPSLSKAAWKLTRMGSECRMFSFFFLILSQQASVDQRPKREREEKDYDVYGNCACHLVVVVIFFSVH